MKIERIDFEGLSKTHPKTEECLDDECIHCGYRDCPWNEPLHYHHDGCPACTEDDSIIAELTDSGGKRK